MPPASIVIPTRQRLAYLEVALASIAPQAAELGAEVLVVDDGGASLPARALASRFGARYQPHPGPLGLNVARNTGVEHSLGELVVFVDDDVRALPGWLGALLHAAQANPDVDVFAGRIQARLEGPAPRACGREGPPITSLDLGEQDADTRFAWGANMAIRRAALERIGPFDVSLEHGGDEQEWQERLRTRTPQTRVRYVAAAVVEHRRVGADARLRSLARGAYARGRAARRFDARRAVAPSLARETITLARCVGHVLGHRCPAGMASVAHSAGRLREGVRERVRAEDRATGVADRPPTDQPPGDDFLSGASGTVGGADAVRRRVGDELIDGWEVLSGRRRRLRRAASHSPAPRRVLVLSVQRPERHDLIEAIDAELARSRHHVDVHACPPGDLGKFQNLNRLLSAHPAKGYDWLLTVDDDVELGRGFLDRFLFLCERFSLALAQPAHRLHSHAAWPVTRRHPGSVVRETSFVEIGPVTAFAGRTFPVLLPFPNLRMGWGLDAHWAAVARQHGWRCGVVDAVSINHRAAPAAADYPRQAAVAEARSFLAQRPYLSAHEAARTLTTHHGW
jgi:GT2 family glycosyltransferase